MDIVKKEESQPLNKERHSNALNQRKSRSCPFKIVDNEVNGKKQLDAVFVKEAEGFMETFTGTPNPDLARNIITCAVNALPNSLTNANKYNIIHQALADATPRDAHEAMLTTQAVVLHNQAMDFLERSRRVLFDDDTFAKDHWHKTLMNTATRLFDLHTKTIDALMRYRQKGEQRIVVQHVNVNHGGKAIIGGNLDMGKEGEASMRNGEVSS